MENKVCEQKTLQKRIWTFPNYRNGKQSANYFGSVTQSSTVHLGWNGKQQVYVPFNSILPLVDPNDLVIDGWDINNANLYEAMLRARVYEPTLIEQLRPYMEDIIPKPSIYYPDFIASNQGDRVNHVIPGTTKKEHLEHIRRDIREFKEKHSLGIHQHYSVKYFVLKFMWKNNKIE